ncbi:MAG: glycosyltransferase family 2 protein [Pseudomonadota bacterium]
MRVALVITTYERPDALAAVLQSVGRQRAAPDEIVIADDGSGPATRELVQSCSERSAVPIRFVSQPHSGFRVARLRNLAIAATSIEYLILIDGDMVLHPEFVADHLRIARRGFFTQGVRVHTDEALTRALIADPARSARFWSRGAGGLRRAYLMRSVALSGVTRSIANAFIAIKSCNQAFWREDLVRVNGFNEAIEGWGPEDKELVVRIQNAGVHRQSLLFGGIACHLHHPPASRAALAANIAVLEETVRQRRVRCERGLDAHFR